MSTLLRETQPAQNRIAGYLPQHADANGNYVPTGENFPLPVLIKMITGMMPVQFQETLRTQETNTPHTGATVLANTWNQSEWIDVTGYENLVASAKNDTNNVTVAIDQSHDKATVISNTQANAAGSTVVDVTTPVKARYARVAVKHADTTNPHTMSSWLYKKS
jgi:hypothetical protein